MFASISVATARLVAWNAITFDKVIRSSLLIMIESAISGYDMVLIQVQRRIVCRVGTIDRSHYKFRVEITT